MARMAEERTDDERRKKLFPNGPISRLVGSSSRNDHGRELSDSSHKLSSSLTPCIVRSPIRETHNIPNCERTTPFKPPS